MSFAVETTRIDAFLIDTSLVGTGAYAMWLLNATKPGDNALMGEVTVRVRYFYAVTLALNVICSGTYYSASLRFSHIN